MKAFCTVVSRSHLPQARALADSLRSSGNREVLFALVTDGPAEQVGGVQLLGLNTLAGTFPAGMPHYFDAFELCNALKPFLVRHLFSRGVDRLVYLDSDVMVTGSFDSVWERLDEFSLLLIPHHLSPPPIGFTHINEAAVVDMGFLNGGFAAWRKSDGGDRILEWMCSRFPVYGFCNRREAMFVDQKLLPLLLEYFPDDVGILRSPGLNIAFWNAHERPVRLDGSRYRVGAEDVVFFHMSGFRLSQSEAPCSYLPPPTNESILAAAPWFARVLSDYRTLLERHTPAEPAPEYGLARLGNWTLTPDLRRLYFRKGSLSIRDPETLQVLMLDFLKRCKRRLFPYRSD